MDRARQTSMTKALMTVLLLLDDDQSSQQKHVP
jgi:hypothetical protein